MSNILTFPAGGRDTGLRNPAFDLPAENVTELDITPRERRQQLRQQQEPQTETAKNGRLRKQRRDGWCAAEARTRYWSARMKLHSAIESASQWGAFPKGVLEEEHDYDGDGWMLLVRTFRSALAQQLLTPAWRSADVAWKRKALAAREHRYTDLTDEQIERAIQQDVEFLAAHPARRKREGCSA